MKACCEVCKQVKSGVSRNRQTRQLMCCACYGRARYHNPATHEQCSGCGQVKTVQARTEDGKAVCPNCNNFARYHDPATHEQCSGCGQVKTVQARTEDGKAVCPNCYRKRKSRTVQCADCGKEKIHAAKGLCWTCYARQRSKEATTAQ